ncbi:hypothetical protein [Roseateles asaccharophilus]|uniref:Uncharacterized protein n=1 Tax=Roseateles asaccharophilus TaxID=582607 RepID=A0ABU2A3G0_9BURK|nr:hypothetical protein [Roseateles asaccharophilus]MDR7331727.1 hypothetical protein [Roseateles asaccharophilus]
MPGLDEKKPTYAPAYMVGIYPELAAKARELGYALALHGSLQRDLDLIAVPWTDAAVEPLTLVKALCECFDVAPNHDLTKPEAKPHGRLGWSIPLWWGAYLDLAVLPRVHQLPPQAFGGMRNVLIR